MTNTIPDKDCIGKVEERKKRRIDLFVSDLAFGQSCKSANVTDLHIVPGTFSATAMWLRDGNVLFGPDIFYLSSSAGYPDLINRKRPYLVFNHKECPNEWPRAAKKQTCDIVVASGENKLVAELRAILEKNSPDTRITQHNLNCGDVVIISRESSEVLWIGERKDKSDFVASIIDGRHHTQQAVMLEQNIITSRISYLIEGNPLLVNRNINPKAIIGSLIYPSIRHGFNTIMSDSLAESAAIVAAIHVQLEEADESKFSAAKDLKFGNILNQGAKKSDLTERDQFIGILSRVPRVSDEIAEKIADAYPSLAKLQIAFLEKGDSEMLENIQVPGKSEHRRIGPALSKAIYEFLGISELKAHFVDSKNKGKKRKVEKNEDQ